jgi:P27 family predicted phage terminase small subunit
MGDVYGVEYSMLQRGRKSAESLAITPLDGPGSAETRRSRRRNLAEPPAHLSIEMKAWWTTVLGAHDLDAHRRHLLQAGCEAWDVMTAARKAVAEHGLTYNNREGEPRPRPEVAIARDARIAFVRIIKELDLDPTSERHISGVGILGPPSWDGLR